jgi:recombination protein RecA
MKLTSRQRSILVGTVLGDGFLQKTGSRNAQLRLEHGGEQKAYLQWKADAFSRLFQGEPKQMTRQHPHSKETYTYWRYQSNASPAFGVWRQYFYDADGTKHIPRDLGKYLSPLAIAVWYMDDGYFDHRDRASHIYLGRVTRRDVENARNALAEAIGIHCRVKNKKEKGFVLHFAGDANRELHEVIGPYMLDQFSYKCYKPTSPS